jgi:hypothetical protein
MWDERPNLQGDLLDSGALARSGISNRGERKHQPVDCESLNHDRQYRRANLVFPAIQTTFRCR